jgi:hypothetical protein
MNRTFALTFPAGLGMMDENGKRKNVHTRRKSGHDG